MVLQVQRESDKPSPDLNAKKGCLLPQLTAKAKLCHTDRTGRRLVARQKILPGTTSMFFWNIL